MGTADDLGLYPVTLGHACKGCGGTEWVCEMSARAVAVIAERRGRDRTLQSIREAVEARIDNGLALGPMSMAEEGRLRVLSALLLDDVAESFAQDDAGVPDVAPTPLRDQAERLIAAERRGYERGVREAVEAMGRMADANDAIGQAGQAITLRVTAAAIGALLDEGQQPGEEG